jgi:tRNA A37 threonylcarbamoyladenosine synthetase subunit TsaC/SUA5/YrdC
VLPRTPSFTHDLGGGEETKGTAAVRIPEHPLTLELLNLTGPLAVTSANPSGEPAASDANDVRVYFQDRIGVLDGGPAQGRASTTISLVSGFELLREGAIDERELRQTLMS